MFTIPVSTVIRATAAAVVISAISVGGAGIANAERPMSDLDQEFLLSLSDAGITFDNPSTAVDLAGSVCSAVADGYSYDDLFEVAMDETDLSADQADTLLFDSVFYYCVDLLPYVL
jgi:hypothetical protein